MSEFWYYIKKYDDMDAHEYEDGASYQVFKSCGLLSGQESITQLNKTFEELKNSFLKHLCDVLYDYKSVKSNYKNFSSFWISNKNNYSKFFKQELLDCPGHEIVERYFKKSENGLVLNDEMKEEFDRVYQSHAKIKVDPMRSSGYGKNDVDYFFYRDNQFNTFGPKDEPGSSNQRVGNIDPMFTQFPMKKYANNV